MEKEQATIWLQSDGVIAPAQAVALVFGVTVRTLNDWVKRGCPREKRGFYNIRSVMEWRYASSGTPESLEKKKQIADIRYREARADMEEIRKATIIGEYVSVEEVEGELRELFGRIRVDMLGIKQKIISTLYATYPDCALDAAGVVEKEMERGLTHLAGKSKNTGKKHRKRKSDRTRNTKAGD